MIFNPMVPVFIIYALAITLLAFGVYCAINKRLRKTKVFRRIAIVGLLLIILARPAISGGYAERDMSNLNVFFVVDNTGSMAAKDMENNTKYRYEAVREDMKKIIDLFPGSRYAIITLDYNVFQAMPLIDNATTAYSFIDTLSPKTSTGSSDTDLSKLLDVANERIAKYSKRFPERDNIFIFFSDGEDHDMETKVPKELNEKVASGAVIGYGTTNGTHIGVIDYKQKISETNFIVDKSTGAEHISKLDEKNLHGIADRIGVAYYRRSSSNDKFDDVDNFAKAEAVYHHSDELVNVNKELYWVFALVALILLLWDFCKIINTLSLERKVAK